MSETGRRRHRKPRSQTSCAVCHRRKVKCNNQLPCDKCIRYGCEVECRFDGAATLNGRSIPEGTTVPIITGEFHTRDTLLVEPLSSDPDPRVSKSKSDEFVPHKEISWEREISRHFLPQSFISDTSSFRAASTAVHSVSQLPTHDWTRDGPQRGRSHYMWTSSSFDPLVQMYVDSQGYLLRQEQEVRRLQRAQGGGMTPSSLVHHELPSRSVCDSLVHRFFETWNTVFPIIDPHDYEVEYLRLQEDPKNARVRTVILTLLMCALANSTFPGDDAPLPHPQILGWLDLASSNPIITLELEELDVESVRLMALLNLGKQSMKYNETADYIYSGAGLRSAMTLGLDRITSENARSVDDFRNQAVWDVVRELDLHACLASGAAPTVSSGPDTDWTRYPRDEDSTASWDDPYGGVNAASFTSDADLQHVLSRSLPVRYKIVTLLNTQKCLRFDQVMQLHRELARSMSPVLGNNSKQHESFKFKYLSFVHSKFLMALHRPFATLENPAFYLCRALTLQYSQELLTNLCSTIRAEDKSDPFGNLITGYGTMFRTEMMHATMTLCFELYRNSNGYIDARSLIDYQGERSSSYQAILQDLISLTEKTLTTHGVAVKLYLVTNIVLVHSRGSSICASNCEDYHQYMIRAGQSLAERFLSFFQ